MSYPIPKRPSDFTVRIDHDKEVCEDDPELCRVGSCKRDECECQCGDYFIWVVSDTSFLYRCENLGFFSRRQCAHLQVTDGKYVCNLDNRIILKNDDRFIALFDEAYKTWWASQILGVSQTNPEGG